VARGGLRRLTQPFRPANLDERDPDGLRDSLPVMWLVASLWFRAEVRGMGNVPADGPVLLVGNHSGGNMSPDTFAFALAFSTYFGVERRLHLLTASHVFSLPGLNHLRKAGVVTATNDHAHEALDAGGAACVYPGGSHEAHRPSWQTAALDLGDLEDEVQLALDHGAPLVPVVSIGGQETALFLTSGERLSSALRLDRVGISRVPIALALPWVVNVGDLLGHLPLPSKIVVEVLPPIDVAARIAAGGTVSSVAAHVRSRMQDTLDAMAAERKLPVLG
jgi:1-acyl-sn-glycerol-3-phosphate acyltransferase